MYLSIIGLTHGGDDFSCTNFLTLRDKKFTVMSIHTQDIVIMLNDNEFAIAL
jgi:hypothetical protein